MLALDTPIQFVKGIGPAIAKTLAEKNILSVEDLLYISPFATKIACILPPSTP